MQQKVVITGGPGTGKTSIIKELEKRGYYCHHEIIRDMTFEAKKDGDPNTFVSNPLVFVDDPMEFNKKILNGRAHQFITSDDLDKDLVFFDRGIPDVLAYMDFFNQEYDDEFIKVCKKNVYDTAFILPPWEEIYVSDNERLESYEEALQIHGFLEQTYTNLGYDMIKVPTGKVKERVDFILNQINNE